MSITFNKPDIASLSSTALEIYVAAIFQSTSYFVKRDLLWDSPAISGGPRTVNVLQADGLAYFFSPMAESKILIECKGGGTFVDFFKFSGITKFIDPNSAFFICNNSGHFNEIHDLGKQQNIIVLEPKHIINRFSIANLKDKINNWYWSNEIQCFLISKESLLKGLGLTAFSPSQTAAFLEIKKYDALLSKVWTLKNPTDQSSLISQYFDDFRDFVRKTWRKQGLKSAPDMENAIGQNILCESAANVVLKAKVEYLVLAVRCAINALTSTNVNYVTSIPDAKLQIVVQKMIDSIELSCRLPNFLQYWIYQFGGILNTNGNEISILAKLLNERDETIKLYITFLEETFTVLGDINWGIRKVSGIIEFKGVPESLKGYGMYIREINGIDIKPFVYRSVWFTRLKQITE